MNGRILAVKTEGIQRGVVGQNAAHVPDVVEVTFADVLGQPHTIYPHAEGPFADPEAAVTAWENGSLHAEPNEPEGDQEPHPPAGPVFA